MEYVQTPTQLKVNNKIIENSLVNYNPKDNSNSVGESPTKPPPIIHSFNLQTEKHDKYSINIHKFAKPILPKPEEPLKMLKIIQEKPIIPEKPIGIILK